MFLTSNGLEVERKSLRMDLIALVLGFICTATAYAEASSALGVASARAGTKSAVASVEQADQILLDVAQNRVKVEALYADQERICDARFFVTRCLDEARGRRREAMSQLRAMEIEANRYKRRANVDGRDKALADSLREKPEHRENNDPVVDKVEEKEIE
ncbi:MAG: hypothetical protein V4805_16635 [Pseudomonadota bacterium]